MDFQVTEQEFKEIEARLAADLDSFVSEPEIEEQEPLTQPTVLDSIVDTEFWKNYIRCSKEVDQLHEETFTDFSEIVEGVRAATKETFVEVQIPEQSEESFEESAENFEVASEGHQEKYQNEYLEELQNSSQEEDLQVLQFYEVQQMTEEDMLASMLRNWEKKQQQLEVQERARQKQLRDMEIKREAAEAELERQKRIKKEQELRTKQQEQEKKRFEAIEAQRTQQETLSMQWEDELASALRKELIKAQETQRTLLETNLMSIEDQTSHQLRKLKPSFKKFFVVDETYPEIVPLKQKNSKKLEFPVPTLQTTEEPQKWFQEIELPKPFLVGKLPPFKKEENLEMPTLGDYLPYPLDKEARSFSLKLEDVVSISGLHQFKNLQHLNLALNQIKSVQNLTPSLVHVDLSKNKITQIPELNLPLLETLILDNNQILQISGLQNCLNLRKLSMKGNKLSALEGLENNTLLEELSLYRNEIKSVGPFAFQNNTYLQHLDLGRNHLREVYFLSPLKLLRVLILYENMIRDTQPLHLPLLKELWLDGNSLKELNFLKDTPLLEILNVKNNGITSICPFECFVLQTCDISSNFLGSFKEIVNCIESAPNLSNFCYENNPFLLENPELLGLYNEVTVKGLPCIKELNNTLRTSLQPFKPIASDLLTKAFELKQIDIFKIYQERQRTICDYASEEFKVALQQLPAKTHNSQVAQEFHKRGVLFHWYQTKKALYLATKAALKIQCWWKYLRLKKRIQNKTYLENISKIIKIQAVYKGHRVRKSHSKSKESQAVKIQALYRGYRLRKRMKDVLSNVRQIDLDLEEFKEVNLDDIDTSFDFDSGLIVPEGFDFNYFAEETLPPIKKPQPQQTPFSDVQKPSVETLPPINKPKPDPLVANHNKFRKNFSYKKPKQLTAEERLQRFRKAARY